MVENNESLRHVVEKIWRRVLNTEDIALDDDFFELGGHSLSAGRVVAMLHRDVGVEIRPGLLFEHSELGEFVRALRERLDATTDHEGT